MNTFLMPFEGTITIDLLPHLRPINEMIIEAGGLPGTMAELTISDFYDQIDYLLELQPDIPVSFNLSQNYPNPFNPVTNIQFDIPDHASEGIHVQLIIYNVVGQLIRTLVNETKFPGQYEVRWDSKNEYGDKVPSCHLFLYSMGSFKIQLQIIIRNRQCLNLN